MTTINPSPPPKLYKYRAFDIRSLRILIDNEIHYSHFASFNDPLDCRPIVDVAEVGQSSLERLFYKLAKRIRKLSCDHAKQHILEMRHSATEQYEGRGEVSDEAYNKDLLGQEITRLLHEEMGAKGIFCLSEVWNCPLMWSHYADQHRGICIEYDTTSVGPSLRAVEYQVNAAGIKASVLIKRDFNKCIEARNRIEKAAFLSKAESWRYEREWRDIKPINGDDRCFKLHDYAITAVYLGLKCEPAARTAVVKLLNANSDVKVFEIFRGHGFDLSAKLLDRSEIEQYSLNTARPTLFLDEIVWPED